jgi:hypothetical protein
MIRYALQCEFGHEFEAWFSSSTTYDEQVVAGQVSCPHCGSLSVSKAIMAPNVSTSRKQAEAVATEQKAQRVMAEMAHRLRAHVEANFDYVGPTFASEARDIHDGLSPQRPIYGEATGEEVKSLIEDGISVAPIPAPMTTPKAIDPAHAAPVSSPRIGTPVPKSRLN